MTALRFGFSPCPNDTFQFHALIHGLVDTEGLSFEPVIADVEELNRMALAGELEMTKASYGALSALLPRYVNLRAGGALGRGCGPLWVTKGAGTAEELSALPIAHPGIYTTAHLLLQLRLGGCFEGVRMVFHEVMEAVAKGEIPSGVIIHEGRFTYREKGLTMVEDLGEWWERTTGNPIPLGCILLRRDLKSVNPAQIDRILRRSLLHARANPDASRDWVRSLAQEMDDQVIADHIGLYVNDYSLDIGEDGERAIEELLRRQGEIV